MTTTRIKSTIKTAGQESFFNMNEDERKACIQHHKELLDKYENDEEAMFLIVNFISWTDSLLQIEQCMRLMESYKKIKNMLNEQIAEEKGEADPDQWLISNYENREWSARNSYYQAKQKMERHYGYISRINENI